VLENLLLIDYRYAKFALDPTSGSFTVAKCARRSLSWLNSLLIYGNRDWRDHNWSGVGSVKNGLEGPLRQQRLTLFGPNVIDIEGKSIISLLVDEVSFGLYATLELSTNLVNRSSTLSTSSRSPASYCGHWTTITIMRFASR
jgi:cation-transporting ATPase 13A2